MAKILKINGEVITVGTDDGKIKEVRAIDLNFAPAIGDEVEVFENEGNIIVSKKETFKESKDNSGISINVSNNQSNSQQQNSSNGTKAVNKVTYCLLAFFLGGIGVHKFYAGKTGSGILCIVFCWTLIPGFIAFIEFIIALCKTPDASGNILV